MKKALFILGLLSCIMLRAQDDIKNNYLSLEVDPAPFLLNGYSFTLVYSNEKIPHLAFTGSVYSSKFPDAMMNEVNADQGFRDMRYETSYAFMPEWFLNTNKRGFYFGPAVLLYNKSVSIEDIDDRIYFSTIFPNLRAGYLWYPFKSINLYLNPWFNLGSEINIGNDNIVYDKKFEPNKFHYIMAIHIGYSIDF